ncbi:hypothetical protein BZL29_7388 [Mycobacterium kansasii]|uniref:Uncharacterized protein n=1 Tax=Mycobacterium kansasii TaxID=1768 RepID=A0A1V3WGI4_MYCKA|nr:hypothetical protein BZL29_7388 [Mycobacterium kansasii]
MTRPRLGERMLATLLGYSPIGFSPPLEKRGQARTGKR